MMRHAGEDLHGDRVRALIVILWRAGLRIQGALSLTELDLDPRRGSVLVRCGKGGRRREIGMDVWGFEHIQPWLEAREKDAGRPALLHAGRPPAAGARGRRRRPPSPLPPRGPSRRTTTVRAPPAPLRARHREGVPLNIIQRQLGHQNLGVTSIDLRGIKLGEIIETIHARRPPMIPASAGLHLRR